MTSNRRGMLLAMAWACALILPAHGQATRTWVSGVGDDVNPCSRTAPCKTFAGAISKTAAGGEIDALDPAGFGAVTITKAMTLDGGGGIVASILVSGTNGVNVNAGASDAVVLRNLSFNGVNTGLSGVQFNSGASLSVEKSSIFGFTVTGINVVPSSGSPTLSISNTTVENNAPAGSANGIFIKPTSTASVNALITSSIVTFNKNGIRVDGGGGTGVSTLSISNSTISNNAGLGLVAVGGTGTVAVYANGLLVSGNLGSAAVDSTGSGATLTIGNSMVTGNATGLKQVAPAVLNSYGNNIVIGNTPGGDISGTITPVTPH